METKRRKFYQKALSFLLAFAMIVTVFTVAAPEGVQAASLTFKGSGKSTVTIKDSDCYNAGYTAYKTNYIKFKATKTGYVTITFKGASSVYANPAGYVTFCNSKKKALGETQEAWSTNYSQSWGYTRSYGVKKGQTYYFAVVSNGGVKITANVTAVTKSSANTKAKAKTLAKGKTAKGVIIAGQNKADWYKIKMTSSQKLKLTYTAKSNGDNDQYGIKVTFYDTDGKMWTNNSWGYVTPQYPSDGMTITMVNSSGTKFAIPAGTYYVKVERYNKNSSGYYTLKWSTF